MKILLICAFFPPEGGSAASLFYELGQALQARGHEVSVLTGLPRYHVVGNQAHYRRQLFVGENYHGLQVYRIFTLNIPWGVPILRGLDQFCSALSFGLAGLCLPTFDLALVYSPPLPLALSTYYLGRLRGRPVILNIQDMFPQSAIDLGVLRNPFLIKFFLAMEAFLYKRFQRIIVHSDGNRHLVVNRGATPEYVTVIANWIDTEAIKPGKKKNMLRKSLGLQEHFVVSFAGIMGYSQDLKTVIQAAEILRNKQNIAFLLVGDGVEKASLQELAEASNLANVIFLPMQPKEEYLKILDVSDLCLVTLRKEVKTPVVPSKIHSIMAAGRPILASLPLDGDAPRLIAAAQAGICLPPEQPELMAEAILKLSRDSKLGDQMGTNGREYAVRHLSLANCMGRLETLFAETMRNHETIHHEGNL